jgi:hypothetical protein
VLCQSVLQRIQDRERESLSELRIPVRPGAAQCSTVQSSTAQCSAVQCSTIQFSTAHDSTVPCGAIQYSTIHNLTSTYNLIIISLATWYAHLPSIPSDLRTLSLLLRVVLCVAGGYFLGLCDPTGTLEEDEIFIHHDAGERERNSIYCVTLSVLRDLHMLDIPLWFLEFLFWRSHLLVRLTVPTST